MGVRWNLLGFDRTFLEVLHLLVKDRQVTDPDDTDLVFFGPGIPFSAVTNNFGLTQISKHVGSVFANGGERAL